MDAEVGFDAVKDLNSDALIFGEGLELIKEEEKDVTVFKDQPD